MAEGPNSARRPFLDLVRAYPQGPPSFCSFAMSAAESRVGPSEWTDPGQRGDTNKLQLLKVRLQVLGIVSGNKIGNNVIY